MANKVLTMGGFDMFHIGHLRLIQACYQIAGPTGEVIVGVNTDEFMESYKRKPVIPYIERASVIRGLFGVGSTFPVDKHDASGYIKDFKPDFLVIGSDWAHKDYHSQIGTTKEELKELGVTLLYKSIDEERTTTATIEEIRK